MWYKILEQQVELRILAKPNAKKTAMIGIREGELHIMLHAKPHQGEANQELIVYLAKLFQVSKSQIAVQKGENSRHKKIILPLTKKIQNLLNDPSKFLS